MRCSTSSCSSSVFSLAVPAESSLMPAIGLLHSLKSGILPQFTPRLRLRLAVDEDDVGGEIPSAVEQSGAHAIRVDRHAIILEGRNPRLVEAAGYDDLHIAKSFGVEG